MSTSSTNPSFTTVPSRSCSVKLKLQCSRECNQCRLPKMQSVLSRNCRGYWNLQVSTRVSRLESNYVLFANCSHYILWHAISGEAFIVISGNFTKREVLKNKMAFSWRPKWPSTSVKGVNIVHWVRPSSLRTLIRKTANRQPSEIIEHDSSSLWDRLSLNSR